MRRFGYHVYRTLLASAGYSGPPSVFGLGLLYAVVSPVMGHWSNPPSTSNNFIFSSLTANYPNNV